MIRYLNIIRVRLFVGKKFILLETRRPYQVVVVSMTYKVLGKLNHY